MVHANQHSLKVIPEQVGDEGRGRRYRCGGQLYNTAASGEVVCVFGGRGAQGVAPVFGKNNLWSLGFLSNRRFYTFCSSAQNMNSDLVWGFG